jgi:histidinol dehydrogenase
MKRSSIGYVTAAGYPELARHAHVLATYEGFDAHANAVSGIRDALLKRS